MDQMDDPTVASTPRDVHRRRSSAREIAVTVVLAILLYWVIQAFVLQTYRVEGSSMDRTLAEG
jgi:signal peptidase I